MHTGLCTILVLRDVSNLFHKLHKRLFKAFFFYFSLLFFPFFFFFYDSGVYGPIQMMRECMDLSNHNYEFKVLFNLLSSVAVQAYIPYSQLVWKQNVNIETGHGVAFLGNGIWNISAHAWPTSKAGPSVGKIWLVTAQCKLSVRCQACIWKVLNLH